MAKNNLITHQTYKGNAQAIEADRQTKRPEISRIYEIYANRCRNSGAMDFDDLLLYTNILFRDNPDILDKYRQKFKYILVDEYQDTNYSQYLIVKKLSEQHGNISVVGDDA
jgi:DNA helicase-2/ATP-dependent DNA helicase PcrA